jgi:HNH endonuclease
LYKICSQYLGSDADADRATVVLYEQADGSVVLADGTCLPDSVAERMRCDCREQHADGSVDQVISPALRRKILRRDGGCTFPGCEQRQWLHIHHVVPRSKGGPTKASNLRARCGFCHHVVHLPGWRE